ncbi:DoxX family protein [Metabacillus herbersteinensis]|uniref:DoxX family protein n=1 Tax=Metabacillus herbersteinensis TaxID=283816 RepID=A0ABV6GLY1_9BACI
MNKEEIGNFLLRAILGVTFFMHGLSKFKGGLSNLAGWFESLGLPGFMAYAVGTIELIGGIALVLGLGTRIFSVLFILIMAGAIIFVKFGAGFLGNGEMAGFELDLVLLVIALHLLINGSRFFSLDSMLPTAKKKLNMEIIQ